MPLLHGVYQLVQVLHAPFRRRIGEQGVTAGLQRDALDLHQMQPVRAGQAEVQPGRAEAVLRPHLLRQRIEPPGELSKDPVGRLCVHVDDFPALVHGDQVVGCLSPRRHAGRQPHRRAGHQQLPAPPRVLHMADRLRPADVHHRDEPVGARQKAPLHHVFVLHGAASPL